MAFIAAQEEITRQVARAKADKLTATMAPEKGIERETRQKRQESKKGTIGKAGRTRGVREKPGKKAEQPQEQ
jgi:hypothetical protein